MKLCDPDLDRQLKAGVDRYDQLPSWMKDAASERETAQLPRDPAPDDQVQGVEGR